MSIRERLAELAGNLRWTWNGETDPLFREVDVGLGRGVLAGDHLKSCSDLGVPIWGVSILYRQGYFTQRIDAQGSQEEIYSDLDLARVPLEPLRDERGQRLWIEILEPAGPFPIDLW